MKLRNCGTNKSRHRGIAESRNCFRFRISFFAQKLRNSAIARFLILSSTLAAFATSVEDDFFRYQTIIDKNIFGRAPTILVSDAENFNFLDTAEETGEVVNLAGLVRLVALSKFQGVPAAGLVEIRTGRTAYLLEGQSMGDFTLEAVSYQNSSVVISKGKFTNEVVMTYGRGQASDLTATDDSPYLSVLNVRNKNISGGTKDDGDSPDVTPDELLYAEMFSTNAPAAVAAAAAPAPATVVAPATGAAQFTAAEIAAATIVDENGESRISYRMLQEIRVQRERERVEAERREQEARLAAERARREQLAKEEADRAAAAKAAADAQSRRAAIEALKTGDETVVINFELTNAEKRELAQAGFDIPGFNDEDVAAPPAIAADDDAATTASGRNRTRNNTQSAGAGGEPVVEIAADDAE